MPGSSAMLSVPFPCLAMLGCAVLEPAVSYEVDLSAAPTQVVTISATAPVVDGRAEFVLPVWRPGRYGVLDFAATVREWSARDDLGRPVEAIKTRKNAWLVQPDADSQTVTLTYSIYANSLGDRTRHVDDSHAFLSGSSVFVMSPPHRELEHRVSIGLPVGWEVATGLSGEGGVFAAPTYDHLVDSPLEIGTHQLLIFDCDGVMTEVAIWGDVEIDPDQIEADFCAVAEATHEVFGDARHFDRYVYIVHAYPGGRGGTEHLNSTVVQTTPATFRDADRYRGFMSLVAHEYFHTWNVKRFRPAGITPYDYDRENYTSLLWLVEGTTSYYDELLLVRAGLNTPDRYLRDVAGSLSSVVDRPGRQRSSLSQSSHDAWLKFWGQDSPDHRNTTVNFYSHGAMVSLALDLFLRDATANKASLDHVMRTLNARFDWRNSGYTPGDVKAITAEVAGKSMDWFFDRFIDGTEAPPLAEALLLAGLRAERGEPDGPPYSGINSRMSNGAEVIISLDDPSPGFLAGLNVGDRIVSVDGVSVEEVDLRTALADRAAGDRVVLGVFRYGRFREFTVELDPPAPGRFVIERIDEPTDIQREVYESWLGQPWPSGE
ncbi:MAG: M61 family metallopeptidase [Phycisphaerales bacterium]